MPPWLDAQHLLGEGTWHRHKSYWHSQLHSKQAADVQARLRNMCIGGATIETVIEPAVPRQAYRKALHEEAVRMRNKTPLFSEAQACLDRESRAFITPEALALDIGKLATERSVLDAGCGVGSNAIAFAREGCAVTALESHPERLAMAMANAKIYGVQELIHFKQSQIDARTPLPPADILFVDPPWLGLEKEKSSLTDYPFLELMLDRFNTEKKWHALWIKLPMRFDLSSLEGFRPLAFFGKGKGDFRRVKFLLLQSSQ
ncbi:MAG: methyltransferase [Myxococcales bacterium]|nr:MAG: methyltransferase [Myxococcales bacterium]